MDSSIGDLARLGKLLEEHRQQLVAAVRRRIDPKLQQRIDPEDVVNEAYLIAKNNYDNYLVKGDVKPYIWLFGLCRDCLFEAWRRETREKRDLRRDLPFPVESSIQLAMSLIQAGTSPSEAAIKAEVSNRIQKMLELLSHRDREILWMRHFEGLTHADAAAVLGISENTANVRYVRALERMRNLWQDVYGNNSDS